MKCKLFIVCFIFALMLSGCLSATDGVGRFFDGSVFTEKTVERYESKTKKGDSIDMRISVMQNKAEEKSLVIFLKKYPMITFRASMPDETGEFHLTSLEYLSSGTHGWNEYSMQMTGTGSLVLSETAALDEIKDMEKIQITQGRISRYDTRITGNEALTALRNRSERIHALCTWMLETSLRGLETSLRESEVSLQEPEALLEGLSLKQPKGQDIEAFQKLWEPIFFPEMTKKRKRPEDWRQKGDVFKRADDIKWNTDYTQRLFPEQLRPIRDSGTLLRDWEEALYWIYLEYEWENIKKLFSQEIILNKTK